MPPMGFELTIPVFERAKTVHALDRAATEIGKFTNTEAYIQSVRMKYALFYCSIAHKLKGAGIKIRHIRVCHMVKFS
jgi:hypothetical protein